MVVCFCLLLLPSKGGRRRRGREPLPPFSGKADERKGEEMACFLLEKKRGRRGVMTTPGKVVNRKGRRRRRRSGYLS